MEDEKLQRLHDTLKLLAPRGKVGGLGYGNLGVKKKDDDLPKNALYANFVRAGQGDYSHKKFDSDDEVDKKKKGKKEKKPKSKKDTSHVELKDGSIKKNRKVSGEKSGTNASEMNKPAKRKRSEKEQTKMGSDSGKKKKRNHAENVDPPLQTGAENKKRKAKNIPRSETCDETGNSESDEKLQHKSASPCEWSKHIRKHLKAAPGRTLRVKDLRRLVLKSMSSETSSWGKDKKRSQFESAVASIAKVTREGKNLKYGK